MNRNEFLRLIVAAAVYAMAGSAPAQSSLPRLVWLSPVPEAESASFYAELRNGLRELGYVEGRNISLSARYGDGTADTARKLISEVLEGRPTLVISQGSVGPLIRRMNPSVPVVFGYSGDPIEAGMIESFARPGGMLTGISYMNADLVGKRMEMLKEVLPSARRVAVIASPDHFGDASERRATQAAATKLGLALEYHEARAGIKLPELLAVVEKSRPDAALFFPTQGIIASRELIAAWATKNRIPAISGWSRFAEGGNVMSYGPNLAEASRRLAFFVDRILKGAKPGDLPVELPSRVEFVINQRAAKAIGLNVSQSMLLRADRVIE